MIETHTKNILSVSGLLRCFGRFYMMMYGLSSPAAKHSKFTDNID